MLDKKCPKCGKTLILKWDADMELTEVKTYQCDSCEDYFKDSDLEDQDITD